MEIDLQLKKHCSKMSTVKCETKESSECQILYNIWHAEVQKQKMTFYNLKSSVTKTAGLKYSVCVSHGVTSSYTCYTMRCYDHVALIYIIWTEVSLLFFLFFFFSTRPGLMEWIFNESLNRIEKEPKTETLLVTWRSSKKKMLSLSISLICLCL